MFASVRPILAAALAITLVIAPGAQAQESQDAPEEPAADPGRVLATVNGAEITLAHVVAVRAGLPQQYDQFPAQVLYQGILDQLIQQTLLMQSFDGELSLGSRVQLENDRRAVHAGEVIAGVMAEGIDDAALRDAYEAQYPADTDEIEYHAAHILVDSEEAARALLADLAEGAEFGALAREKSTGPSASVGGDLGWFGQGDMVPEFFDAVAALEPGEVSAPVQTDFGWHVVKLNEVRDKERPAFEEVRAELRQQLQQNLLEEHVAGLMEAAEVERTTPEDFDPAVINDQTLLEN